jgi:hypothetical protein
MKKIINLLFATLFACSFVFVSCGDDKEAVLTPEQQKEKIQADAISFLNELEGFEQEKSIVALVTFNKLVKISEPEPDLNSSDDLVYEDLYGKYTWNGETEEWDYSSLDNQAEFIFPLSNETNGKIVVTPSSPVTINTKETGEKGEKIPKNVNVKIYSGSEEVGALNASSNIQDDASIPSETTLSYQFGQYALSFQATKGANNLITATLKKGNKTLIDASVNASGNPDSLIANQNPGDIKGNVSIKLNNTLAFIGTADVTKYMAALVTAEEKYYEAIGKIDYSSSDYASLYSAVEKVYNEAKAKAFNDFFELYLASSNEARIARLKMESREYTESWEYEGKYSDYTYTYTVYTLEFNDKTTVDAEVYFSTGFDQFLTKLSEFIGKFGFK